MDLASDSQIIECHRITTLNEHAILVPFDIPVVAAVGKYRTGIGHGGEQTRGIAYADTQGVIVEIAVGLDIDTGLLGLFHHDGVDKRILTHAQAIPVVLQDDRNHVRRRRGEVGTFQCQAVQIISGSPVGTAPVPCEVHVGLVVGLDAGNSRETASPAYRVGQSEIVHDKVDGAAVPCMHHHAVGAEPATVGIGKRGIEHGILLVIGQYDTNRVGRLAEIPKHARAGAPRHPKVDRVAAANRHFGRNELGSGGTQATYHRNVDRRVAITVGMCRHVVPGRSFRGHERTNRIGRSVVPSVKGRPGSGHGQTVAQAKRIEGEYIDAGGNDIAFTGMISRAAGGIGSRAIVMGEYHDIDAVAVFHVSADIGSLAVGRSHQQAVMVPSVLRRVAVCGVVNGRELVLVAAEQRIVHFDDKVGTDGICHQGIAFQHERIDRDRTRGQTRRAIIGINHRRHGRAVGQLAQILDKDIMQGNQVAVNIPVHMRSRSQIRSGNAGLDVLQRANRQDFQRSRGNDRTYAQYRVAIAVGMQFDTMDGLAAIGRDDMDAVGGMVVLPQVALGTVRLKPQAVALDQGSIHHGLDPTVDRLTPLTGDYGRATRGIRSRTTVGGRYHHIHAVTSLDIRADVGILSVHGIHMDTVVEPCITRVIAVCGVIMRLERIAFRTEKRIGDFDPEVGRDGIRHLDGVLHDHRIHDGTQRIVNRINHRTDLGTARQYAETCPQRVVRVLERITRIPIHIGSRSQIGSVHGSRHRLSGTNLGYIQNGGRDRSGLIVERNLIAGVVATVHMDDTAQHELLVSGGHAVRLRQVIVPYRVILQGIDTGSRAPTPGTRRVVEPHGLPFIAEVRVAHAVRVERAGDGRISRADQGAGSQVVSNAGHVDGNRIAVERIGDTVARRNIGERHANLRAVNDIHGHFLTRSMDGRTGNGSPLVDAFHVDGVEMCRNLDGEGAAVIVALEASYILQPQTARRIAFADIYRKGYRSALAESGTLSGIERVASRRIPDGIGQAERHPVLSYRTFHKHFGQCRIGIPTHDGTVLTVESDQRIHIGSGTETAVAPYLDVRHHGRFGQGNDDDRVGDVLATGTDEFHAGIVFSVAHRLEQAVGLPCLAAVYRILDLTGLFHGNAQADGSRIERTRFKTAHIQATSLKRTGLGIDDGTERIVNRQARFTFVSAHRGGNAYPIAYGPFLDAEHGSGAVLGLDHMAQEVVLLPVVSHIHGGFGTIHVSLGIEFALASGTNGSKRVYLDREALGRFYGEIVSDTGHVRFVRTQRTHVFRRIHRHERKLVVTRLEGPYRKFLAGKGDDRGVDFRNATPYVVDIRILQTSRHQSFERGDRIETDRLGSVDGNV